MLGPPSGRTSDLHEQIEKTEPISIRAFVALQPGSPLTPLVLEIQELRAQIVIPETEVATFREHFGTDRPRQPGAGDGSGLKPERVQ